jgi:hypothetical protein
MPCPKSQTRYIPVLTYTYVYIYLCLHRQVDDDPAPSGSSRLLAANAMQDMRTRSSSESETRELLRITRHTHALPSLTCPRPPNNLLLLLQQRASICLPDDLRCACIRLVGRSIIREIRSAVRSLMVSPASSKR